MALVIFTAIVTAYAILAWTRKPRVSREIQWLRTNIETADSRRLI